MPWSVELSDPERWVDIVIGKPNREYYNRRIVRLRDGKNPILCEVWGSLGQYSGFTVIVHGSELTGLRMVEGFKTVHHAVQYATLVRPDINARWKSNR